MRALEEVALSYDQKAEEAAKTGVLQKKLDDAELRSDKLSNVFILHVTFFVLKLITFCERCFGNADDRHAFSKMLARVITIKLQK